MWVWLFSGPLIGHYRLTDDPGVSTGDARQQIPPFFRYEDPSLFVGDPATSYYLACYPVGYKSLYILAAKLWSVSSLSHRLPYLLLALVLAALGAAAYRFAGKVGVLFAVALGLGSPFFLLRLTGGLPRGFGFPIAACALAALVWGRPRWLAAVVVAGAAFYPAAAMPAGLALAGWLLLLPAADRGRASGWSFRRRLGWVVGTAALAGLTLVPSVVSSSRYGSVIRPADVASFPEAGPRGRYSPGDRAPFPGFARESKRWLEKRLPGAGPPLSLTGRRLGRELPSWLGGSFWWLLGVAGLGWALLCLRRSDARRGTLLPAAGFVGYYAAAWVAPLLYLPQRYVFYPVPLFAMLVLSTGGLGLLRGPGGWLGRPPAAGEAAGSARNKLAHRWLQGLAVAAVCGVFLFFHGARGARKAGVDLQVDEEAPVYRFIAGLPADARLAGWPDGLIDNVPLLTRRQALVTYETHQAFHRGYTRRMRARTRALIDAFFAVDPGPLLRLRDEFEVTHLLIDRPAVEARDLTYFRPFTHPIRQAIAARRGVELEVFRQIPAAAAFDDGRHVVLDLSRVEVDPEVTP